MAEFILEGLSQGDVGVSVNKKCEDIESIQTYNEDGKRLIHCSDGVMHEDEFLSDEDLVDHWDWLEVMTLEGEETEMSWTKWPFYKVGRAVGHTLKYLETWGESLAEDFGMLQAEHQDILDMHERIMEDAGEPITGFPEPSTEPVQSEPTIFSNKVAAEEC